MRHILLVCFTESERLMHEAAFAKLFPQSPLVRWDGESAIPDCRAAVVNCCPDEWEAQHKAEQLARQGVPVVFYAERPPSPAFIVRQTQQKSSFSYLLCPQSRGELAECARCISQGNRFVSRAALHLASVCRTTVPFDFSGMNDGERIAVYGLLAGKTAKEIALISGTEVRAVEKCIERLHKKSGILTNGDFLRAVLSWMSFKAGSTPDQP